MYSVTTRRPPGRVVQRTASDVSSVRAPRWSARDLATGGCGIGRCRSVSAGHRVFFGDKDQRDLAPVVDVGDLHAQLVADVHNAFELGEALSPTVLGDVPRPVPSRKQR